MKRKALAISAFLTSITASASAQVTGGSGQITSVFEIISEILGINVQNPYNALAVLATLGIMCLSTYIILKIGAKKLDIEDTVLPGSGSTGGGRNILAVLSVLITLTIFGTGAASGLIQGFQAMFTLGFLFLMIAVGAFVVLGGTGVIFGGGAAVGGASLKATADGMEKASNLASDAEETLFGAEKEIQDGAENGNEDEEEDAAEEIQQALKTLNDIQQISSTQLEDDRKRVQDAMKGVREELELEEDEYEKSVDVDHRIQRAEKFMELAEGQSGWSGSASNPNIHEGLILGKDLTGGKFADYNQASAVASETSSGVKGVELASGSFYGLQSVYDDLNKARKELQLITKDVKRENNDQQKAFDKLLSAVKILREVHEHIVEVQDLLDTAEQEDQQLEQIAQNNNWKHLYGMADQEVDEENSLEKGEERLEQEEQKIRSEMDKAMKMINKHMKEDDQVIDVLRDALNNGTKLEELVKNNLLPKFDTVSAKDTDMWSDGDAKAGLEGVANLVEGLENILDKLENQDELEEKRDREFIDEINQYLNDL